MRGGADEPFHAVGVVAAAREARWSFLLSFRDGASGVMTLQSLSGVRRKEHDSAAAAGKHSPDPVWPGAGRVGCGRVFCAHRTRYHTGSAAEKSPHTQTEYKLVEISRDPSCVGTEP